MKIPDLLWEASLQKDADEILGILLTIALPSQHILLL